MVMELRVPEVGESIREVEIAKWLKNVGDQVKADEDLVELETDKATVELPAPGDGVIVQILKQRGEMVPVGAVIAHIDESGAPASAGQAPQAEAPKASAAGTGAGGAKEPAEESAWVVPSARRALSKYGLRAEDVPVSSADRRLREEDVLQYAQQRGLEPRAEAARETAPAAARGAEPAVASPSFNRLGPVAAAEPEDGEEIVPMTSIRRRIAERLVEAQHNAALLTTFNEIDMSAIQQLRSRYQEAFQKKYQIKLGFMSFFVKAVVDALGQCPALNAEIRDQSIVYRRYYHIGIAVGGGKGLVVPVIRHAERMSFAEIEKAVEDFGRRGRDNKILPQELQGGTFTISNGGVYGSLLSTPIVNPPQSGVLGMHSIQQRPVAVDGQVVIRPMMYVALTYDHRIVDGREAVTFLKRIKETVEDPARILMEV